MRRILALVLVPLVLLVGVGLLAGGAFTAAVNQRAAACTFAVPDPNRIAIAMEQLTTSPVDETHWALHAPEVGLSALAWTVSTLEERHQLLTATIAHLLTTHAPHAVTTPVIVWWHGTLPTSNDDHTWQTTPIPGWNGTLDTYLTAFTTTYATSPATRAVARPTPATCTPTSSTCHQPANITAILATIRHQESGGDYTEQHHSRVAGHNPASGNPTGAYQYIHDTWANYAGYDEAFQAPPAVQDQRATQDITSFLTRYETVDWVPVAWYIGPSGADHVRDGTWPPTMIPNPALNTISIGQYQTTWMQHYTTIALPAAGHTAVTCPTGAAAVIAWADTQIGAPYATINPYRFGTPAWPGGNLIGLTGHTYTFPAGTTVYDCSGFVIAAWRQGGIDYPGQYGIYTSDQWNTPQLPDAPPANLQPGDIAIYSTDAAGNGHVVLIHHTDPTTGIVHTIESSGSHGVHIGTLDWTRVIAIKRTP